MTDSERESLKTVVDYLWRNETNQGEPQTIDLYRSLVEAREILQREEEYVAIKWHPDDVKEIRPDLSTLECREVLQTVLDNHDAKVGVNWDQIGFWANELYPQNERSAQQASFHNLVELAPELREWVSEEADSDPKQIKFSASGAMPLFIKYEESAENSVIVSLSHYFRHSSGEMLPDPEMKLLVDFEQESIRALDYRDNVSYQRVVRPDGSENIKLRIELDTFVAKWLSNIGDQHYEPVRNQELCYA